MTIQKSGGSDRLLWFRSSYSNGAGGECVECAVTDDRAFLRDSKSAETYVITVGSEAWRRFVQTVKC